MIHYDLDDLPPHWKHIYLYIFDSISRQPDPAFRAELLEAATRQPPKVAALIETSVNCEPQFGLLTAVCYVYMGTDWYRRTDVEPDEPHKGDLDDGWFWVCSVDARALGLSAEQLDDTTRSVLLENGWDPADLSANAPDDLSELDGLDPPSP